MNKKEIFWLVVILIIALAIIGFALYKKNHKPEENKTNTGNVERENGELANNSSNTKLPKPEDDENKAKNEIDNENNDDNNEQENNLSTEKKTLVVYYSAQSHTKAVAEKIAQNLDAELFELVPEDIYTSSDLDWTDNNSRVTKEHEDESLRDVKLVSTKVDNWENYDTVLIGYPIWWGIAAWPVDTFVKANDFEGKTVIPFCTSASSGLGESGKLLKQEANSGNWLDGHRFSSNPSDSDIKNWTDSLK